MQILRRVPFLKPRCLEIIHNLMVLPFNIRGPVSQATGSRFSSHGISLLLPRDPTSYTTGDPIRNPADSISEFTWSRPSIHDSVSDDSSMKVIH